MVCRTVATSFSVLRFSFSADLSRLVRSVSSPSRSRSCNFMASTRSNASLLALASGETDLILPRSGGVSCGNHYLAQRRCRGRIDSADRIKGVCGTDCGRCRCDERNCQTGDCGRYNRRNRSALPHPSKAKGPDNFRLDSLCAWMHIHGSRIRIHEIFLLHGERQYKIQLSRPHEYPMAMRNYARFARSIPVRRDLLSGLAFRLCLGCFRAGIKSAWLRQHCRWPGH